MATYKYPDSVYLLFVCRSFDPLTNEPYKFIVSTEKSWEVSVDMFQVYNKNAFILICNVPPDH